MNNDVYMVEYKGEKFPTREIEIEPYIEGMGVVTIADYELWKAIEDDCRNGDSRATAIDNGIFYYCNSGMVASNPSDTELIYSVLMGMHNEDEFTDDWWYNLMRNATFEIAQMHESGEINCNVEGYECGGDYSVYGYRDGVNHSLYEGKSAKMAAMAAMSAITTIRLMNYPYWSITEGKSTL